MAGGMTPGRGRTLADRSARSGIGTGAGPGAGRSERVDPPPAQARAQHCWVVDAPQSPGRWPGLLTEWRRDADGVWFGQVAWAVDGPTGDADTVLLQAWLPAHLLRGPQG
jgi:hypothetical protein